LEPSQTSTSNSGISDLDWRWGLEFRKGLGERIPVIYILLGFEDILFFVIIPFLKLKVISKNAEIVFNIWKISWRLQKF
jgi:hypothetical protein